MKYLKTYKIFENIWSNHYRIADFCEEHFGDDGGFGTLRWKITGDEIIINGDVRLWGKELDSIPKFGYVSGNFDVRNNKLESFESLPEECGGNYLIEQNRGIKGLLKDIIKRMCTKDGMYMGIYTGEVKDFYRPIFNEFIQKCLEYDVWHDGQVIEDRMREAWIETKSKNYNKNKNEFFYGKCDILSLDDQDILSDQFKLNLRGDWIFELIEKIVEQLKSDDPDKRRFHLELLASLVQDDDDDRIKEVVSDIYDLSDVYKDANNIKNMNNKELDTLSILVKSKLTRSDDHISRDQTHDLFVFIAKPEFVENEDGSYRKKLGIENFLKMNIYNATDLQAINMMKMRARFQMADVYMIWMPKGSFEKEQDSYMPSEIPDWMLKLIDKEKTKI